MTAKEYRIRLKTQLVEDLSIQRAQPGNDDTKWEDDFIAAVNDCDSIDEVIRACQLRSWDVASMITILVQAAVDDDASEELQNVPCRGWDT